MVQLKAPWNERNGRFSPLKAVVFAGLFVPAAWIVYLAATGALEPKVVTEMIHRTGLWAIRFLTLSLLVTPLMRGARYPKLVAIRRMIGVAAFAYACAHLTLYVVDQHFDLAHVASEIALRFYLTIGFVAWLGLAALAATSTDAMIRRLGPEWRTLHSLVYAIAALALLHFMIQAKADVSEPVMMTGFFAILMLFRVFVKRGAAGLGGGARRRGRLAAPDRARRGGLVRARPPHPVLGGLGREHRSGHGVPAVGLCRGGGRSLRRRRASAPKPCPATGDGAALGACAAAIRKPDPGQNVMLVRRPTTSSFLIFCVGWFGLAIPAPGLKIYWMSG